MNVRREHTDRPDTTETGNGVTPTSVAGHDSGCARNESGGGGRDRRGRSARKLLLAVGLAAGLAVSTAATANAETSSAVPAASAVQTLPSTSSPSLWAAIALGPNSLATGYVWNYPDAGSAERAAVNQCNASDCQVIVSVTNGCGVLVQSNSNYRMAWDWGGSLGATEQAASKATKGHDVRVLGWACSGYATP